MRTIGVQFISDPRNPQGKLRGGAKTLGN